MKTIFKILIGYFLFLLLSYMLGGCATIEKMKEQRQEKTANQFFDAHPEKDALRCHDKFPPRDSTGETHLDSVHKADNIDHTKMIDSLNKAMDSVSQYWISVLTSATDLTVEEYKQKLADATSHIIELQGVVQSLKKQYKPCEPEKEYYTSEHWYPDPTAPVIIQDLQKQLKEKDKKLDDANRKISAAASTNKIRLWMLIAAGAIIILLIVLLYNTIRFKHKLTIPPL